MSLGNLLNNLIIGDMHPAVEGILYLLFFILAIIFISCLYTYYNDKTPNYIKKNIEDEDRDIRDEIKKIEETFTRALTEDNSKTTNFFINAVRNNYGYLRLKQLYIEREKEFSDDENCLVLLRKTHDKILNEGAPKYSDCQKLFDLEILKLYKKLSQHYVNLKLTILPFIETSHKIDLSNDKFFFVNVGKLVVPHFATTLNKNIHFYIYPTVTIKYNRKGQMDITRLQDNKITLKTVEEENTHIAILSFDNRF